MWEAKGISIVPPENIQISYYSDSITELISTPDTLGFKSKRIYFSYSNGISSMYDANTWFNVQALYSMPGWIAQVCSGQACDVLKSDPVGIEWNKNGMDTIFYRRFYGESKRIDTSNCQAMFGSDIKYEETYAAGIGLTHTENGYFIEWHKTLIGYNLNGNKWGTLQFPLGIKSPNPPELLFYPNPVQEILFLPNPQQNCTFTITDLTGKIRLNGLLTNTPVDVTSLPSGIYLLQLTSETSYQPIRFIKN